MATTTLTSKGQMTLPKEVRENLGVGPGDKIDVVKQGGVYVLRPQRGALELFAKHKRAGQKPVSIQEMDDAIGEAVTERYESSLDRD